MSRLRAFESWMLRKGLREPTYGAVGLQDTMTIRGRHRTTDKEGARAIARIRGVPGVTAVIIGQSVGGKSLDPRSRNASLKIQRRVSGGCKAVIQTSRGIQEVFIRLDAERAETALTELRRISA